MPKDSATSRQVHRRRSKPPPDTVEEISLGPMRSIKVSPTHLSITVSPIEQEEEEDETLSESPLLKIIEKKKRKDWAKVVAPVDEDNIKKQTESISQHVGKIFSKIPSPVQLVLNFIEHRNGYTVRSYFQYIIWLFYLNIFTFILCFTCITMPTYIYSKSVPFSTYAMDYYNRTIGIPRPNFCTLEDQQCTILNQPLSQVNETDGTCLSNPYAASSCCSLHAESYFVNSSRESEDDRLKYFSDLVDGTGVLSLSRLFLGYYQNLTRSDHHQSFVQTYNMGLAVFLTVFACLLVTGVAIIRKYADGMKRSYVQTESFRNDLFQYIFARWNYRTNNASIAARQKHRFKTEITNVLLENDTKALFKFDRAGQKIAFQMKRIGLWLLTLIIFAGSVTAIYFVNRFTFQERAKKEMKDGQTTSSRARDLAIEYFPSVTVSLINLSSQFIFGYMRDLKLYTRTTSIRHYLVRVILMRLILLFAFVFIVILQITCNGNQCGRQSKIIDCADIQGQATFIHCWETLLGQVMYRLIITDTLVMLITHLIVDPLRSSCICCCGSKSKLNVDDDAAAEASTASCLCQPLEFEIGDYVLDLTYTQALCWHGLLFCPFLPLIAALKNLLIFAVKWLSLACFRRRSNLELSPARARYIFTAVLLFSFVWALLPITFFVTSLIPSRGCGPFRVYSDESEYYIYYSVRNLIAGIPSSAVSGIILKLSSAVVVIPMVLVLILLSCILTIRRNSYRGASVELYKLLYSSHATHRLAVQNTRIETTNF